MFERYTEKARRVIFFARYEAAQFGSPYIETEHLLLGLLREDKALAERFLTEPPEGADKEILDELKQSESRMTAIQTRVAEAIRAHEFAKARELSDEERREHSYLTHLRRQAGGPLGSVFESIRKGIEQNSPVREKISTSVDLPLSGGSKRALAYAAEEAERMLHEAVSPAHLLLGLLREETSRAAQILRRRGVILSEVRAAVADSPPESSIWRRIWPRRSAHAFARYQEKARRAIFFARYEAAQMGSPVIETEHILLGILREDPELAARFLGGEKPAQKAETPEEIKQAESRLSELVKQMEFSIAAQDFVEARRLSNQEQVERENLRKLLKRDQPAGGSLYEAVRREIDPSRQPGEKQPLPPGAGDLPLSHKCKRVLAYSHEEAERLSHSQIGPEHLFLGLLREESCRAAQILRQRGVELSYVRAAVGGLKPPDSPGPQEGRNYV